MGASANNEPGRIAGHLRQILTGSPWHGTCLDKLLPGVTAEEARARPLPGAHSIWELVLHMELWIRIAFEATQGVAMPRLYGTEKDWLDVENASEAAWADAKNRLFESAERAAQAMEGFSDSRLRDTVPGRDYNFQYLFQGVVDHTLHHEGQIAMLKRVVQGGK